MALAYFCDKKQHLVCLPYSIKNLHIMAGELGIKRGWYHGGKKPHYDIQEKRMAEIESKCTVISSRQILQIIQGQQ